MTVEDGMSGTLDATGWTLGACEDTPHALGNERGDRSGIYTVIKDSRHQDGDRNQDSEYVLIVFQQIKKLTWLSSCYYSWHQDQ